MLRAGFDAFEVKKESDAEAFAETRQALFGVLPADRRWPHHGAAPADAAAPFGKCRASERRLAHAGCTEPQRAAPVCRRPRSSIARCATLRRREVIAAALQAVGRERLALVSSFGTESAALLKVMADVDPAIPVVFLDTGWLFEETLAYRDTLIATLGPARCPFDQAAGARRCRARIRTANCGSPIPTPAAGSAKSSRWRARWRRSRPGSTAASAFRAALRAEIPVVEQDGAQAEIQSVRQRLARGDRGDLCSGEPAAASARGVAVICRSAACPAPAGPRRMRMRAPAAGAAAPRQNAASIRSRLR